MHFFTLFPELLFLAPFSALALRLTLAVVIGLTAWRHAKASETALRIIGFIEIATAVALVLGARTQGAALIAAAITAVWFFVPRTRAFPLSTILLATVLALSLIVTGAGAVALDLPL